MGTAEEQPPHTHTQSHPGGEFPASVLDEVRRRTPTCDLSSENRHPLVPALRRRKWLEQAAEVRRKRAAEQQENRTQGAV
jgi:hypothetical protein